MNAVYIRIADDPIAKSDSELSPPKALRVAVNRAKTGPVEVGKEAHTQITFLSLTGMFSSPLIVFERASPRKT